MGLIKNGFHESVVTSEKVFGKADYITFSLLTLIIYAAAAYLGTKWFSTGDWSIYPFTFGILSLVFLGKFAVHQLRWWTLPFMSRPLPMKPRAGLKVAAVTTFVPGAEPVEMLEKTLKALVAMDYPHETWVLDEGDDERVRDLCRRLGAFHFSRKNLPSYQTAHGKFQARSKHGNYNAWFEEIGFENYEIIASFDPDHIPEPNFLSETLGYFEDESVGYVQAAQVYYNQNASFIARGAAEETYAYYSATQMFCYTMGYPIVTGCHCTHRTKALREVGGFPAHDAEDLYITLLYRAAAWKGVYVPKILARGLTPVDWSGYFKQQLRWARSVLDIKFRVHPKLVKKLAFKEIIASFLHGFYYLQGLTTLIVLLVLSYMLATGANPKAIDYLLSPNALMMMIVLLLCDFYRQAYYLDRRRETGFHWRAHVLQFAKYPYLVFALYDVVLNRRFPYAVTNKVKGDRSSLKLFAPHLLVAALVGAALIGGIFFDNSVRPVIYLIALIAIGATLAIAATTFLKFPAPYDASLSPAAREKGKELTEPVRV